MPQPAGGRGEAARPAGLSEAASVSVPHVVHSSRFVPLRSVLPAVRSPERRDPRFARILRGRLCACRRAYRGGAVRAPDCARESQGAPLPCVSQGFFRAGANGETKRPRECRLLPSATYNNTDSVRSIPHRRIISKKFGIEMRLHCPFQFARLECKAGIWRLYRRLGPRAGALQRRVLWCRGPGSPVGRPGRRKGMRSAPVSARKESALILFSGLLFGLFFEDFADDQCHAVDFHDDHFGIRRQIVLG